MPSLERGLNGFGKRNGSKSLFPENKMSIRAKVSEERVTWGCMSEHSLERR
jgi:hypothetical protein